MKIDKEQVREVYLTRGKVEIYKYQYFEHAVEIGALRKLGVKHRLIAELLNKHVKDKTIDRDGVCRMWLRWKELGYITDVLEEQIERYVESIKPKEEEKQKIKEEPKKIDSQWNEQFKGV